MQTALIKYRDYVFSTTGRPQFGRSVRYETDVPNTPPVRATVTFSIQQIFKEGSFADNQARYTALRTALLETEGALLIQDENETELVNRIVRVETFEMPAQWGQHMTEVTVSFSCVENFAGGSAINASYTPTGGAAISLPKVMAWKESIRTERYGTLRANRKETNGSVSASGRVRADPLLTPEQRRAWLQGQEASIKAGADSKDGTLAFGAFSRVVKVESLDTDLRDGTDYLDWSIVCSYRRYPANDDAEADYTIGTRDDLEKTERQTSVRGTVHANSQAAARTKAESIVTAIGSGKIKKGADFTDRKVDGHDGAAWYELTFSADFRETLTDTAESWTLTISDKDDLKSGQLTTTYAGKVTAETAVAALAKARELGDNKYPYAVSSTETTAAASIAGAQHFVEVTFSYDYIRKGALSYVEVSSDTQKQTFGLNTITVSGYATAPTEAAALSLARGYKPAGLLRSEKETPSTLNASAGGMHNRVDFSYTSHVAKASGSIQYQVRTAIDLVAVEVTTSWSGTAWADTEAAANTLIDSLIAAQTTGKKNVDERTSSFDSSGATTVFTSRSFNVTYTTAGSLDYGDDGIIDAEYSLETTFSVNQAVITPIPYGTPHVQVDVGITPALVVASGSVTARTEGAGKAWARTKVPAGGHADPYREKAQFVYVKGSHTTVRAVKFDFTYAKRHAELSF